MPETDIILGPIHIIYPNQSNTDKIGNNGRAAVSKIYNWEIEEKKLITLYKQLIS